MDDAEEMSDFGQIENNLPLTRKDFMFLHQQQEKPEISSKTRDLLPILNYVDDSAALLETHENRNVFELLWCNKKFEKGLELNYFSANQAFDFKIFKFEAI